MGKNNQKFTEEEKKTKRRNKEKEKSNEKRNLIRKNPKSKL